MYKVLPISISLFGPNTPEWQLWLVIIFMFVSALATVGGSFILEQRFTSPYTLAKASSRQKWKWAAIIMFWQTLIIPILGLIQPILSPLSNQWPAFPLFCSGLWLMLFPIAVAHKRWVLERQLKSYQKMDKMIKSGFYQQLASNPLAGWILRVMNLFSNTERKKFFETGYLQEGASEVEIGYSSPSWFVKLMDHANSVSLWFSKKYPNENILFASMVVMMEVDKEAPISWLPRLYQRRGVAIFTEKSLLFKTKILSSAVIICILITLIPLIVSAGIMYLIYYSSSTIDFESFLDLILIIVLLIPLFLFLMTTFAFGLSIFHYRPHQQQFSFQDIQNIAIGTSPGVTRRYPSLTFTTTTNKTFNFVFARPLPDEITQLLTP